jgi:hypothetical protein
MDPLIEVAEVPTQSASRYLQQLCKHWSHKFAVYFTPTEGTIVFPRDVRGATFAADATVTLRAREAALEVLVEASDQQQLEGVKAAVASHLDRFAFREAPLAFVWR